MPPTSITADSTEILPTLVPDPLPTEPPAPELHVEVALTSSQHFISDNQSEASIIAKDLNFNGIYGHPSNMCGPLAISILQESGVVDVYVNPRDFWLINPRVDQLLLENTPNDDLRIGILKTHVPDLVIYNKRGSITDERMVLGDSAIIEDGEKTYLVLIFAYQGHDETSQAIYEDLEMAMGQMMRLFRMALS